MALGLFELGDLGLQPTALGVQVVQQLLEIGAPHGGVVGLLGLAAHLHGHAEPQDQQDRGEHHLGAAGLDEVSDELTPVHRRARVGAVRLVELVSLVALAFDRLVELVETLGFVRLNRLGFDRLNRRLLGCAVLGLVLRHGTTPA